MTARRVLFALLVAQVGLAVARVAMFFADLSERATPAAGPRSGSALLLVAAVIAVAALHASPRRNPGGFAAAGLVTLAALALGHTLAALALGRLYPSLTIPILVLAAACAAITRSRVDEPVSLGASDAISAALLAAVAAAVPYPYLAFDTKAIWACRSAAFLQSGSLADVRLCAQPGYPPLYSVLLWLGDADPLLGGRVLVLLLVVLFALFLRARLARVSAELAAPSLLFLAATTHVWRGAATWYADVPLAAFLVTGVLLARGRSDEGIPATRGELAAGAVCLAAAALVRPDGLYAEAAVLAGLLVEGRRLRMRVLLPFLAGGAAALAWMLRPASWSTGPAFYVSRAGGWHPRGSELLSSLVATVATFLDGTVAQWLTHNGLGVSLFALGVLAWLWRRAARDAGDARVYGALTLAGLASVALCYLAIPFVGDPTIAARPEQYTYQERYLRFIWSGMGRVTVHLLPFAAFFAAAVLREAAQMTKAAAGAREERAAAPPRTVQEAGYA